MLIHDQVSGATEAPVDLRGMVLEASQALARLDAARLEELAVACWQLQMSRSNEDCRTLAQQTKEAAPDMAVFARVLAATRENLRVMNRLRTMREGRLEYRPGAPYGDD